MKRAGAVQHLDAKIHGVYHQHALAVEAQLGGIVELAVGVAVLADLLEHVALHVEHENLVAQRVGYVNSLRRRIHGNSGGTLVISFSTLQAADGALKFASEFKEKN